MRDEKRLFLIKQIKQYFAQLEKNYSSFNLISLNEKLRSNSPSAPVLNDFITNQSIYEDLVLEKDLSEDEIKELNEIKDSITRGYGLLDFDNYDSPEVHLNYLIIHYRQLLHKSHEGKSDGEIISELVNEIFGDNFAEYEDNYFQVVILAYAYILTNLLIKRKELTEEQYLMMAPHLYPSSYHPKALQLLPIIKFEVFENDYEWSKGNAESIALILETVHNIDTTDIFNIKFGNDSDDGDSASPTPVKA